MCIKAVADSHNAADAMRKNRQLLLSNKAQHPTAIRRLSSNPDHYWNLSQ